MEAEDPLSELADIHLPDAVSFWPPAPGWWLVGALLLAALAYGGLLLFRRWQQQRRLAMALHELEQVYKLYTSWQQSSETDAGQAGLTLLHGCNSVLKRVALVHYPEQEVASLSGQSWLRFLDRTGATDAFSTGSARVLGDGSYRRSFAADNETCEAIVQAVQQWIKRQYRVAHAQAQQQARAATPDAEPGNEQTPSAEAQA